MLYGLEVVNKGTVTCACNLLLAQITTIAVDRVLDPYTRWRIGVEGIDDSRGTSFKLLYYETWARDLPPFQTGCVL